MKFGAVGCSHTSKGYGDSWPIHLGNMMNGQPLIASSSGAGNSMFIEKVRKLCDHDISLMVVQITEPTRVTTGMAQFEKKSHTSDYNDEFNDGGHFDGVGYYTWNSFANEPLFARLGYTTKIDEFWRKEVMTSDWCYYNTVHAMLAIESICQKKGVPVIFFSWFLPFDEIIPKQYDWINKQFNLVKDCALNFLKLHDIKSLPDNHYGSEAHSFLVKQWLYRQIQNFVL